MPTPALPPRLEAAAARGLLNLPAPILRLLAGTPIVRDGQTLDVQTQLLLRLQRLQGNAALGGREAGLLFEGDRRFSRRRRTQDVVADPL